jgi:hypothetical protein
MRLYGHSATRLARVCTTGLVVLAVLAVPAAAQDDVDVPRGYEFCGWQMLGEGGGWTYDDPEPGAYLRLFAREMSCRTARRKYKKVDYEATPPYRVRLRGYRCVELDDDYEYSDTRCSKKRRKKVALRWQTGV